MNLKGYRAAGILIGNSVQSMGFFGGLTSGFRGVMGGEIKEVTDMIHAGRQAAFIHMVNEAKHESVHGIVGVSSELRGLAGNSEFLFVGSGVLGNNPGKLFTSAGDAQELYCHMDAGYDPIHFVFGNIAYSVGLVGGIFGSLKTLMRGEIREFSDIFNETRHHALSRLVSGAVRAGANAVVGIRTNVMRFNGFHEMVMSGTAARHPHLPVECDQLPVTSDLTGEELWALSSMGYAPIKLLISTSVYSLGAIGGVKAIFRGLAQGEIGELTTLVYDARENVFDRLKSEANAIGAEEVVGTKTYIVELGSGLIEIVAIGTAVRKLPGFSVQTATLPCQAIIRDKDTWLNGDGGFELQSIRAGG
ncbi:heavy metal-binding domain-containing protein [Solimicrobium silvestre]|uniref:Putative heavy-metal-binding n=1 Tax=Solimicrobium silvestre TaxID=2099400 RepID=A0A2S9H427_9BURK|nr:heavy metal-binding domain-containing protein [Solimicrobium silvestre]PRC94728.1 putative heavy-metal-binding [Solimicrobium silvestre]